MDEIKYDAHGELLCVEETTPNDMATKNVVKYSCAQDREGTVPEGGTFMPSDHELLEKIRGLTPDLQEAAIEILLELLASQQTSSCSPASIGESCP